jgi:hypothetical protein
MVNRRCIVPIERRTVSLICAGNDFGRDRAVADFRERARFLLDVAS